MLRNLPQRLSLADVERHYKIPGHYLWRWHRRGCPALNRKLRAVRHPTNPRHFLYWHHDVAKAAAAITPPVEEFEEGGERWLWTVAATRRYGVAGHSLLAYRDRGCPALPGKPRLPVRWRLASTLDSPRLYERLYFRVRDLEQISAARRGELADPDWMTRRQIRDAGVTVASPTLTRWQVHCPPLDRRLKTKPDPRHRRYRLYWRADIKALKAAIVPVCDEFEDAGGRWMWTERAAEVYQLPSSTLDHWIRRGCPHLVGGKLRARVRLMSWDGRFKLAERRFLRDQDLKAIVAARAPGIYRAGRGRFTAACVTPAGTPEAVAAAASSLQAPPADAPRFTADELEKLVRQVANPSCSLREAARAVGRDVGQISRWAKDDPKLVAARDDRGRAVKVYIDVLHWTAGRKKRRASAAIAEARMERLSPEIVAERARKLVAQRG